MSSKISTEKNCVAFNCIGKNTVKEELVKEKRQLIE
jgi:hypothetical protein